MSQFEPYLFVSVGETGAMYTLRETYLHEELITGKEIKEIRSRHLFNLSVNADIAFAKASVQASQLNMKLATAREDLDREKREIQRMTDIERMQRAEKQRAYDAENYDQTQLDYLTLIEKGIYPIGRFKNKAFHEADPYYITWLVNNIDSMESDLMRYLAKSVARHCAHLVLPECKPGATLGDIGASVCVDVIILNVHSFKNRWGKMSYITSMITHDGISLVVKSSVFHAKIGQRIKITGLVKEHGQYRGQTQTRLENVVKVNAE